MRARPVQDASVCRFRSVGKTIDQAGRSAIFRCDAQGATPAHCPEVWLKEVPLLLVVVSGHILADISAVRATHRSQR
jgi:hypothetical protein